MIFKKFPRAETCTHPPAGGRVIIIIINWGWQGPPSGGPHFSLPQWDRLAVGFSTTRIFLEEQVLSNQLTSLPPTSLPHPCHGNFGSLFRRVETRDLLASLKDLSWVAPDLPAMTERDDGSGVMAQAMTAVMTPEP